jgi:arylsulfatase A-like enzyme/Flp pilus assembly protein TadD
MKGKVASGPEAGDLAGHEKRNRSSFIFVCFLSAVSFLNVFSGAQEKTKGPQLNVLLITIDTLRPDRLSCYQSPYLKTPNMDRLAETGVLFTRAFAHTPLTLPSHANILLGLTPVFHGVHDNYQFIVREEFSTLAEHLKNNGYSTGAFVAAYILDRRFGLSQGFDVYDDDYERPGSKKITMLERRAEEVVDKALDWLKIQSPPWFLWIHCFDPHDPYDPPDPFKSQYKNSLYDGEVAYVDFALGKLLRYMQDYGVFDSTLVIFTGDHGESLGQHEEMTHGFLAYNSTLRIPLIIRYPGSRTAQVSHPVSHVDIFPTVCDVLKIEKPRFLQGSSLLPLDEAGRIPKRPIYFESLYPYYSRGWAPMRGFLQGTEKFIDSPIPEIYDLNKDFDELRNLAESKRVESSREILGRMVKDLSSPEADRAEQKMDRESLEKLRSLGYVSSHPVSREEKFGPEDDIKGFLLYNNKAIRAMELYHQGKAPEGIELLKKVLEEKKSLDSAYFNLAKIYEWEGRIKEALEVLKSGMENTPSSYELFFNYIGLLVKAGLFDEAIRVFNEKSHFQTEVDPELLNELGIAYSRKGSPEKAIEFYTKALALDSQYPLLHNNLGAAWLSLYRRDGDSRVLQKSLKSFKKAIELDGQFSLPYNGLGMAYRQTGNLEGAIYCWEKALELEPESGPVLYDLGLAYMDRTDYAKALRVLNEYHKKYSHELSPEVRKKLESSIQFCKEKTGKR